MNEAARPGWSPPPALPERYGVGVGLAALPHQEGSVSGDPHQHVLGLDAAQVGVEPPGTRSKALDRAGPGLAAGQSPLPPFPTPPLGGVSHSLSALVSVGLRDGVAQPHLKLIAAQRRVSVVADEAVQGLKHQVVCQVEAGGARLLT